MFRAIEEYTVGKFARTAAGGLRDNAYNQK